MEIISLSEDTALIIEYQDQKLYTFWRKLGKEYPFLSARALKVLIPFVTT